MKKLSEILPTRGLVTLPPGTSALDASRAMALHKVGAVLVVEEAGAPAGIFTERDLMIRVVVEGRDPAEVAIGDVMTRDLYCASAEERVSQTAAAMQERHIRHLPVTRDGKVIGLLSLRDLLRTLLRQKEGELEALTDYIRGPVDDES